MSESKDSAALGPPTAAPGGLAAKSDSAPNTQSANTAINAASNQGYLSKLLGSGFGFGSGTAPTAVGRTPATVDQAHEYHPGKTKHYAASCSRWRPVQVLSAAANSSSGPKHLQSWPFLQQTLESGSRTQVSSPVALQLGSILLQYLFAELALYRTSSSTSSDFDYYHTA